MNMANPRMVGSRLLVRAIVTEGSLDNVARGGILTNTYRVALREAYIELCASGSEHQIARMRRYV